MHVEPTSPVPQSHLSTLTPSLAVFAKAIKLASLGARCAINYANDTARAEELLAKLAGSGHVLIQGSMFTKPEAQAVVAVCGHALTSIHLFND